MLEKKIRRDVVVLMTYLYRYNRLLNKKRFREQYIDNFLRIKPYYEGKGEFEYFELRLAQAKAEKGYPDDIVV